MNRKPTNLVRLSSYCLPLMVMLFTLACRERGDDPKVVRLKLPEGFRAERLYGPSENGEGSWVSMTFDPKGRLLASDQYGAIYRLTLPSIGSGGQVDIEPINVVPRGATAADTALSIGYAQGLLWAYNSLYVMVNHRKDDKFGTDSGLYRLQDTDNDDRFDTITMLRTFDGSGEHGPHSIVLSPDKSKLFIIAGNYTKAPAMQGYLLPRNFQEDNLFPLFTDPNGHAAELRAPGGWIATIDSVGNRLELYSAGYRNAYDIAFNEAGDLFTYDSDMEWDFGLPWYRPTRICHVTSGSEYGWRTGTTPWSPSNGDNLPPVINIGQGSPTNLLYGGTAKFPEKYKRSLFAFDWSFGIIYAIHLSPEGSSYSATGEEFVSGAPLPLTDGAIGPDGALYFLTGGRRLESDLYRVYYTGTDATTAVPAELPSEPREIRRSLEAFHGDARPGGLDKAWPYLSHDDRFIRYAARVAVEHQPVATWEKRALEEKDPTAAIHAMIALARQGDTRLRDRVLNKLVAIPFQTLGAQQQLDIVRAVELTILRMGKPLAATRISVINYLDRQYPANNNLLDRALSKVLISLDAPGVVTKTMALLASAKDEEDPILTSSADLILRNPQYGMDIAGMLSSVPPAQQTYFATVLSSAKNGWTEPLRTEYFKWFYKAFSYKGGHSFYGYIDNIRKSALENAPAGRFDHYNKLSGDSLARQTSTVVIDNSNQPKGPGRAWKLGEAVALVKDGLGDRDFENGRRMFNASLCMSCHMMRNEGGAAGPNLTQLGTRFTAEDMLEALIEPGKTISDQYQATIYYLKAGGSAVGRQVNEDNLKYYVAQNPFAPTQIREIAKSDVLRTMPSQVSPMPPGTINRLNPEELKDLLAYLMSGGDSTNAVYTGKQP